MVNESKESEQAIRSLQGVWFDLMNSVQQCTYHHHLNYQAFLSSYSNYDNIFLRLKIVYQCMYLNTGADYNLGWGGGAGKSRIWGGDILPHPTKLKNRKKVKFFVTSPL